MTIKLFPHQEDGVRFLTQSKGTRGLFFGMGTGKTLTSIYAAKKTGAERIVAVAPPIALSMWEAECTDHMEEVEVQILKTGATKIKEETNVIVVSYAIATTRKSELREWLAEVPVSVLIMDESHAVKSTKAKRTKALLGRYGVADGATYVWLLTGTPITRWNDDVFPFLCRADLRGMKRRLGGATQEKFLLKFTIRQKRQFPGARFPVNMVVGNRNTEELADWMYGDGLAMRVDLDEVFEDMPPLTTNHYVIGLDKATMGKEAMERLKELEKKPLGAIRKALEASEPALATVRRELGLGKVRDAAKEIRERVEAGQSVLVGAWHTDVIEALADELSLLDIGVIRGGTSHQQRDRVADAWNNGELDVLIGQIAAMGVSLNLQQGGHNIIVVEEDWSPAVMDQFYARLWRFGQEKHVHVDILQSDTKLDKALNRISGTKAREHKKFNEIGREITNG